MNKAIFLDRDGTINIDYGYVHEKDKLQFLPNAVEGLKKMQDLGFLLIVITNQSGVNRGYFSMDECNDFNNYMKEELEKKGVYLTEILVCPHIDEDDCECRKPKLKLFYDAIKKYDIDLAKSYVVGDKKRDLALASKEKVTPILITNENDNEYVCQKDLLKTANYINSN